MLVCQFCSKECKSKNSVIAHQAVCKSNPEGKNPADWATGHARGVPSWNAGLKGDPRLKCKDSTKKIVQEINKKRSPEWHKINGDKISAKIRKKVEDGSWHTSLAKRMHFQYKGFDLHGSWELAYAKFLDQVGTPWCKNSRTFEYEFEGKKRRYTPDFYLPLEDVYVEIKGYKTEKDVAKWEQFPETLVVLMKEELQELNLI